jgi:hypothetical protein
LGKCAGLDASRGAFGEVSSGGATSSAAGGLPRAGRRRGRVVGERQVPVAGDVSGRSPYASQAAAPRGQAGTPMVQSSPNTGTITTGKRPNLPARRPVFSPIRGARPGTSSAPGPSIIGPRGRPAPRPLGVHNRLRATGGTERAFRATHGTEPPRSVVCLFVQKKKNNKQQTGPLRPEHPLPCHGWHAEQVESPQNTEKTGPSLPFLFFAPFFMPSVARSPMLHIPSVPSVARSPGLRIPSVPSVARSPGLRIPSVPSVARSPGLRIPSVPSVARSLGRRLGDHAGSPLQRYRRPPPCGVGAQ